MKIPHLYRIPLLLIACLSVPAHAQQQVIAVDLANFSVRGNGASGKIVEVSGQSFDHALRVDVPAKPSKPWKTRLDSGWNQIALRPGDVVTLEYYDRRVEPGQGGYPLYLQRPRGEWKAVGQGYSTPKDNWTRREFVWPVDADYPAGSVNLTFHLGKQAQKLEFGGFRISVERGNGGVSATQQTRDTEAWTDVKLDGLAEAALEGLPSGAKPMMPFDNLGDLVVTARGPASAEVVDAPEIPGGKAIRYTIPEHPEKPWHVQLATQPSPHPIKKGEVVYVTFWMRTLSSADESGAGRFAGFVQKNNPNWQSLGGNARLQGDAGSEWKQIHNVIKTSRDYPAGFNVALHLGLNPQVIEIGGLSAFIFPPTDIGQFPANRVTYGGSEPDAPWRAKADQRIRQHRMQTLTVQVNDTNGNPVPDAQVQVQMQEHAFMFGTFFSPDRDELTMPDHMDNYLSFMHDNFNTLTLPIYWADFGWAHPKQRQLYLDIVEIAQREGFRLRLHPLINPGWRLSPRSLRELENNPEALRARIMEHIEEIVPIYREYDIEEIEVFNEPRHKNEFAEILGREIYVDWFKKVRELAPDMKAGVNENSILTYGGNTEEQRAHLKSVIRFLQDNGQNPDFVGFQGHFNSQLTHPARVVEILDEMSELGVPIRITEHEIDILDRQAQADYTRDLLTAIFSHPNTDGFIFWGFWEGNMWRPNGALLNKDWSSKPAHHAYRELVYNDWWTQESGQTNRNGSWQTQAFKGRHKVSVTKDGQTVEQEITLGDDPATVTIQLAK